MVHRVVTPWETFEELLTLRDEFFCNDHDDVRAARARAVETVQVYEYCGRNIPVAVECTAILVDALLRQEKAELDHHEKKSMLALALHRVVTTTCENYAPNMSLLNSATRMGLPRNLVTLRNRIAHHEIPPISALLPAAESALEWHRRAFWEQLTDPGHPLPQRRAPAPKERLTEEVKDALKLYRNTRISEMRRESSRKSASKPESQEVIDRFLELLKTGSGTHALVEALFREKMLIPANRSLGDNLAGAFQLWLPLLTGLCDPSRTPHRFLEPFVTHALTILFEPLFSSLDPKLDPFREAVALWLVYVLADPPCKDLRESLPRKELRAAVELTMGEAVINAVNPWSSVLLKRIIQSLEADERSYWRTFFDEALAEAHGESGEDDQTSDEQWQRKVAASMARRKRQIGDVLNPQPGRDSSLTLSMGPETAGDGAGWKRRRI